MDRLRLDGYVRVSQVRGRGGDSFISPAIQRERIEAWAAAFGHDLAIVHEELDVSGARGDRPRLLDAIERVEAGEINGIVVAKLDRFARSLIDGLRLIERIRDGGGTFVSVADGLDISTDTGRLVLRIMLSLAEFELDRVRGNWQDAKTRAVMRGIHPSAVAPFGYRRARILGPNGKQKEVGALIINPVTGPLVAELFASRLAGAGPSELADWLTDQGAHTQHGRSLWSHRAVKDILRNRVYLGEASCGDIRCEGAHEPLVDPATFAAIQWRGVQFRPRSDSPSPIRPLLRCAGCRYAMRAERRRLTDGESWYFTCRSNRQRSAWACAEPAAIKDGGVLEQWIVDRFFDELPALAAQSRHASPRLDDLQHDAARAQAAFEQWRDDARVQQQLGMDAYLQGLSARQDALNEALSTLAREQARVGAVVVPGDVAEIRARWDDLMPVEQRDLLQSAIRCVFVRGSRRTAALDGRVHIIWHGQPVDLPSRGSRTWQARPFVFDD